MKNWFDFIHPEGWRFVGIFAFATIILYWLFPAVGCLGIVLTLWCAYFFRDPKRVTPLDDNFVISPADGKVVGIHQVVPPEQMGLGSQPCYRISIFLNVFDVHINRAPVAGVVERIIYYPGKFLNASLDKASTDNERNAMIIKTPAGYKVGVVQIAGFIARRIVTFVKQEDVLSAGQRYGLIRFGSRADVYLPQGVTPQVIVGQYMIGGETILADLRIKDTDLPQGKAE
ncbi:MAG: phosphatidylserine decarboxylase [Alphaproteobacteria bacterium]|nr:phosphatidylserine decarboxylase [Alphaproteobacteria bacterium]